MHNCMLIGSANQCIRNLFSPVSMRVRGVLQLFLLHSGYIMVLR
jgi:hypothetical protein